MIIIRGSNTWYYLVLEYWIDDTSISNFFSISKFVVMRTWNIKPVIDEIFREMFAHVLKKRSCCILAERGTEISENTTSLIGAHIIRVN